MIIDCELYFHGAGGAAASAAAHEIERLDSLCREAGVDRAVLMPSPTFRPRNRLVAEALQAAAPRSRERFLGCALLNPHFGEDAVAELERAVREWGFRAAKLMPTLHAVGLAGSLAHPVMRKARELTIPVTIHSGESPAHPLEIGLLAEAFPDVPVVMDHMGYRNHVGAAIAAAKRTSNLYLMTTAVMEPHCIRDAVRELGADRVVFGSNGPSVPPAVQLLVIRQVELSAADERKVLGENAARLLRL
jgi:predicted TIM-barrel fold metal-dependent hydrolase